MNYSPDKADILEAQRRDKFDSGNNVETETKSCALKIKFIEATLN
jgi:hypothetical protein